MFGGAGLAYAVGLSRMWGSAGRGRLVRVSQARNFVVAQVVVAAALAMPHGSLTAHMVQHVLLLMVAAPLLAMGAPLPTMLWALPDRRREWAIRLWRAAVQGQARKWALWVSAA